MCMVTSCSPRRASTASPLSRRRRSLSPGWRYRYPSSDSKQQDSTSSLTWTESDSYISLETPSSPKSILKVKSQAESEKSSFLPSRSNDDRKKVNFEKATVHVHIHSVTLGDNPSVSNGPPVSLDWKKVESLMFTLEDFYLCKDETRSTKDLLLPKTCRREWLLAHGFSKEQIHEVEKQMKSIRKSRKENSSSSTKRFQVIHKFIRSLKKVGNH